MKTNDVESFHKAYVTKYALTSGIQEKDVRIVQEYAYSKDPYSTQYCPGQYHNTLQEAVIAAEKMRARKIASLKKQITKLEAMCFQVEGVQ